MIITNLDIFKSLLTGNNDNRIGIVVGTYKGEKATFISETSVDEDGNANINLLAIFLHPDEITECTIPNDAEVEVYDAFEIEFEPEDETSEGKIIQ